CSFVRQEATHHLLLGGGSWTSSSIRSGRPAPNDRVEGEPVILAVRCNLSETQILLTLTTASLLLFMVADNLA
ncbi:hypothetical protein, partial [Methylobacterium nigriterrae]|uniref:hypothetical protein n=1 Tax=Methylobacterium nigriterrae TaxID=3127512 RepID=UPI003013D293